MTASEDDDVTRLRVALARIARSVDRQVTGDGLTRTQLSVLGTVARLGPLGPGELADVEGLNPTMLSRIIGKLEAAGLVGRAPRPDDGRAVVIAVTRDGRALHKRLRRERTVLFAERLAELPDDYREQLTDALPAIEALSAAMVHRPAAPSVLARGARR